MSLPVSISPFPVPRRPDAAWLASSAARLFATPQHHGIDHRAREIRIQKVDEPGGDHEKLSLKLPDAVDSQLNLMASHKRTGKAALVQEAIEAFLAGANGTRQLSCYELAPDLWGSVEGPGDLWTNSKHMEGYGQ
jgi:hypothetical protein